MKHKYTLMLSVLLVLMLLVTACSSPATIAGDLMTGVQAAERPQNPDPPDADYTDAVTQFSLKLLEKSADQPGNVLVSPASVYLALAMTLNGADGATRTAMKAALASAGLSDDLLNTASRDWITLLEQTGNKTELFVSNAIWVRDNYPVSQDFLQRNADYYRAAAHALDFSQPEAVKAINDWVSTATRGKIDEIVDAIDEDVMMYLINAIYFRSDWEDPFVEDASRDADFHVPGGAVQVPFMNRTALMDYIENDDLQGIYLPYIDESFAFFALLPGADEDVHAMCNRLDSQTLSSLIDQRQPVNVDLSLPKFEIRYEVSLVDQLSQLGMAVAFSKNADFSRMHADGISDLLISEIKHKTFCRVDEKGSEAAAVTSVEMRVTSLPAGDERLIFDRPFLFGILDTRTGIPLFLGILENPQG